MSTSVSRALLIGISALILLFASARAASAAPGDLGGQTAYPAGAMPQDVATGDFDGDGADDVAVVRYQAGLAAALSDGSGALGTFATVTNGGAYSQVATADLDEDGLDDLLALRSYGHALDTALSNGDGTFTVTSTGLPQAPGGLATGDFDGDGNVDVVTGSPYHGALVRYGDGAGGYAHVLEVGGGSGNKMGAGDLNDDGRDDLLTSESSLLRVRLAATTGRSFGSPADDARFDRPSGIVTGFIDDDDVLDVASGTNGGGTFYAARGNGNGTFMAPQGFGGNADHYLALADLDGDGRDELLDGYNDVTVRRADTSGAFGAPQNHGTNGATRSVAAGDLDADGYLDVVTGNLETNDVSVLLNEGASTDLSVAKTADVDSLANGEDVTYTLTATNDGPDEATGVAVADELPDGLEFVSASDACQYEEALDTVFCDAGDLPAADDTTTEDVVENEASFDIVATATQAGTVTNIAAVTGDQGDPDATNDTDSVDTVVTPVADLSVTTAESADPITRGSTVTYTFTIANAGPDLAEDVVLTDQLPSGAVVTYVPDGCSVVGATVTCDVGSVTATTPATLGIQLRLDTPGVASNTVSVASSAGDPDASDDQDTGTTTVTDTADPAVTITTPAQDTSGEDTTPTFAGERGTSPGDAAAVTLKVHAGHVTDPANLPSAHVRSIPATLAANGTWSATVSPGLDPGQYTARAEQADDSGRVGRSGLVRFTVTAPPVTDGDDGEAEQQQQQLPPQDPPHQDPPHQDPPRQDPPPGPPAPPAGPCDGLGGLDAERCAAREDALDDCDGLPSKRVDRCERQTEALYTAREALAECADVEDDEKRAACRRKARKAIALEQADLRLMYRVDACNEKYEDAEAKRKACIEAAQKAARRAKQAAKKRFDLAQCNAIDDEDRRQSCVKRVRANYA